MYREDSLLVEESGEEEGKGKKARTKDEMN